MKDLNDIITNHLSNYIKGKSTLKDKQEIFKLIYNLFEEENIDDPNNIIRIIIYVFGESWSFSDEDNAQTFLRIYGEPKNSKVNSLEDVLTIFMDELIYRENLKPIFPLDDSENNLWKPYSKANSINFLSMKKLGIYTSSYFSLDKLIFNEPHNNFPLTADMLENLVYNDNFEKSIMPVFEIIKLDSNERFRNITSKFIRWFNSHFWTEYLNRNEINVDYKLFSQIFHLFKNIAVVKLNLTDSNIEKTKSITISGGQTLTDIGKEYIKTLYPLNLVDPENITFP